MASQTTSPRQVFISHATQDADFAHRLADGLKELGVPVWIAPDSILPGEGWVKAIERGLRESSHVVIVLTPAALKSPWVEKEMDVAIAQERKGRIKILPLDVKACEVPLLLSSYQMVSFRRDYDTGLSQLARVLGLSPAPPASRVEAEREVEQLPAEQAGRMATEQPKVGRLEVARPEPGVRKKPAEQTWNWERLRLPLAVVALLALVIGLIVIRPGGDGKPTPTLATSAPVAAARPRTETPTVTVTPTTMPNPSATPEPPTATVRPKPPTPTPTPQPPTATPTPTPTPTLSAGSTKTRSVDGMVMVYVPAGSFPMGSAGSDPMASSDEKPQHQVTLDAFWIDQTEVPNAHYARCVAAGACSPPSQSRSYTRGSYYGDSQYDEYPVVYVSWGDATTYCEWAGGRLPSEAEWEYAARGPDGHIYPWGNDPPDTTLLNYNNNVGDTTQVGSYPKGRSWVGALDMAGNVREWVDDWYGDYPSEPQVNPSGPASGEYRVLRGGCWYDSPEFVRAANRLTYTPGGRYDHFGFRCVVSPGK